MNESCDRCGPAVRAAHRLDRDGELYLCRHCTSRLTPPGSACSVIFGTGVSSAAPGSAQGLHLVTADIDAARADLASRGAEVSDVFHDATGVFHHAGTTARVAGPAPDHKSYGSFISFEDPDGNGWLVQEITTRLPGR